MYVRTPIVTIFVCTGLFYYMLGNIDPKFRSHADCIQLLAVVRTELITKYGVNKILEPFINNIKLLEEVRKVRISKHYINLLGFWSTILD